MLEAPSASISVELLSTHCTPHVAMRHASKCRLACSSQVAVALGVCIHLGRNLAGLEVCLLGARAVLTGLACRLTGTAQSGILNSRHAVLGGAVSGLP